MSEVSFFWRILKKGVFIKRPVCWVLLLLLFLPALTCKNFSPDDHDYDPNGVTYTDVVYSQDRSSVTIYLDGTTVPITNRQSRALSRELAVAGHDYFEVAFYTGTQTVRASWELMTYAHVSGSALHGLNFNSVSTSGLTSGQGAAIIFVGKKTDKTLLGVGKLDSSTNKDNTTGGTTITANTKSVTFKVAALECGVMDPTHSGFVSTPSSFYTNYKTPLGTPSAANTEGSMFKITNTNSTPPVDRIFPKFMLLQGGMTRATYSFRTVADTNFEDYRQGIIVAGSAEYMKKQPRYPIPGGGFQYYSLRLDDKTKITPVNNRNTTPNSAFANPLEFIFDTRGSNETAGDDDDTVTGSTFSLAFQVPVSPLSASPAVNGVDPGRWYIRASYDSYWLDLDDGIKNSYGSPSGAGGAVLIGMGSPARYSEYTIRLAAPPVKYKYGPQEHTLDTTEYEFIITGLNVQRVTVPGLVFIETIPFEDLNFYIGGWLLNAAWTTQPLLPGSQQQRSPGSNVPEELYGMQIIKVEYIDPYTGDDYSVSFPILCSGGDPLRNYTDIPDSHKLYIHTPVTNPGALTGVLNTFFNPPVRSQGTFMLIFDGPFDWTFETVLGEQQGPFLIIILAANSPTYPATTGTNVILGRQNHTGVNGFTDWSRQNAFYFGTWPFDLPFQAQHFNGSALAGTITVSQTHPYIVNAGGPYANVTVTPPPAPPLPPVPPTAPAPPATDHPNNIPAGTGRYLIHSGQGGRIYNVAVDDNVTVLNRDWLR